MTGDELTTLKRLANEDTQRFESYRQQVIDDLIESCAPEQRERLRALQWKIDIVRRQAPTPLAACMEISGMMMERVVGTNGLVDAINRLQGKGHGHADERVSAKILPFPKDLA